jgi:hypothetical protein
MTRQCWTNLILITVICKLFVWYIFCNNDTIVCKLFVWYIFCNDTIISGCIASESEQWNGRDVERSGYDVLGENAGNQENGWSERLVSCLILLEPACFNPMNSLFFTVYEQIWIHSMLWCFGLVLLFGVWEYCSWWCWLMNYPAVQTWAVNCCFVTDNILCLKADYDFLEWTRNFHQQGTRTCLCPGTASWNRLVSQLWK